MKTLILGVALVAAVTMALYLWMGPPAVVPALVFGGIATLIQLAATRLGRGSESAPLGRFLQQHAAGTGLRLLGVVLIPVAVLARRDIFPPIPAAFAFVAVLIPLLFMEIRLAR